MPAFTPAAQSLLVLSMPLLWVLVPSEGALRTVALRPVALNSIVNAVVGTGGAIVAAQPGGGLIVAGRRDRIIRALLPLGVLALPSSGAGCSTGKEG